MINDDPCKIVHLDDAEFDYFVQFVRQHYGIDLSQKRRLIEARLANELKSCGITSYTQYINMLKADKTSKILDTFINKITTNYSYFSRETDHFDYLAKTIIPAMEQSKKRTLKIWSAGCSTGQEPYNIAMAIDSALGFKRNLWTISITATDVSTDALSTASKGVYSESSLDVMPASWKSNYMTKLPDGNFEVASSIRSMVSFSKFNLMDPFLRSNYYDVIFCRNVMIYFNPATTKQLVTKFYQATADGGYFFIGHSETINRFESDFTYLSPSIYRKQTK